MLRSSRPSPRPGFTLVELLMTIAIVAVVAAMVAPRWGRSMSRFGADAAARRILADLAWAQARARITSSTQTVSLNLSASQYQLVGVSDPDHAGSTYAVDLTASPYRAKLVSASAADANGNIVFDGYGTPATSGSIVVQSGDFQYTVLINAGSGSLTIQ